MRGAVQDWARGEARPQDFDGVVAACRASFARLVGVDPRDVCIGNQVSPLAGLVAASLPDGARVVAAEGDFTSVLFPFLAHADRGVEVVLVPLADLPDAVDRRTDLVAVSAVQSATGILADLAAIAGAAGEHGARTFVDATQACGWLPLDATRFDFLVCAAYKWLFSPRGTAFMTVRPERLHEIRPLGAGWYAGEDVWSSIYGGPLRLAEDARRLDTSPAWLSWVGTAPSLAHIEAVGVEAVRAHDVGLAGRLRAGLGLAPGDSPIVTVDTPGAAERLDAAGMRASVRGGAARLSFHLHNTEADVGPGARGPRCERRQAGRAARAVLRPRVRLRADPGHGADGRRPDLGRASARGLLVLALVWWAWAAYSWLTNEVDCSRQPRPARDLRVDDLHAPGLPRDPGGVRGRRPALRGRVPRRPRPARRAVPHRDRQRRRARVRARTDPHRRPRARAAVGRVCVRRGRPGRDLDRRPPHRLRGRARCAGSRAGACRQATSRSATASS